MILQANQTKNNEMFFHESTNLFDLTVVLTNNKLTLTLQDYCSWVIYSKQYCQDDYCKQIHKKMDLLDVFNAFSRSQNDQNMSQQKENRLYGYVFGTIIQNHQLPCYQINKGGEVTTFHTVIDKYSKKQVIYESKLILKKDRNLTKAEILVHNPITEQISYGKQAQLQKQDKELLQKVRGLEQKLEKKEINLCQIKENLKTSKEEINLLKQTNQHLIQSNSQLVQQSRRMEQKFIQLLRQFEIQNQRHRQNFENIELQLKKIYKPIERIHQLAQANSHHFVVRGFQVRSTKRLYLHYIFNQPIHPNQSTKFKLRIGQATYNEIAIGIVDYELQKDKRYSSTSGNAMCYYGHDASLYPSLPLGLRKTGSGFKAGDIVKVEVDREESSVRYSVNGVISAVHKDLMLADQTRIFMPFVEMCFAGDSVEWIP